MNSTQGCVSVCCKFMGDTIYNSMVVYMCTACHPHLCSSACVAVYILLTDHLIIFVAIEITFEGHVFRDF